MGKIYGYARVSTKKQSIVRQIRNIEKMYPTAIIVQETYSGRYMDRKEWCKLLRIIKSKDCIVFDSVSRMSRDAEEGFRIYKELYDKGVDLVFIKEPHISTTTYKKAIDNHIAMTGTVVDYILEGVNKYLLALAEEQIRLAFEQAEKEVEDLRQRTREGIETARLNGKQIGLASGSRLITKKSIKAKEIIKKHSKDFDGSLTDREVMLPAEISRNTYYRYKRQLKDDMN